MIEHSTPLLEDPDRIGPVNKLGVDETSWLQANRHHATLYATGLSTSTATSSSTWWMEQRR